MRPPINTKNPRVACQQNHGDRIVRISSLNLDNRRSQQPLEPDGWQPLHKLIHQVLRNIPVNGGTHGQ